VISKLENVIRNYQDDDLYRFNPVRYAIQTGMAESEAIALFLHATRSGLFTMEWQLVCASCGHLVESLRSMGNLHSHYDCDMCFVENEATLDDSIHVTFTLSPEIRRLVFHEPETLPIEDFYFKYRMAKGIRPLPLTGGTCLGRRTAKLDKAADLPQTWGKADDRARRPNRLVLSNQRSP
jgi:hypothetical protein